MDVAGHEKRRYPRVVFKRSVRSRLSAEALYQGHLAQDISEGGIRIFSDNFIPLHSRVMLQIKFEDTGELLDVEGTVAWIRFQPYSESYQAGIEFDRGFSPTCEKIARYAVSLT